LLRSGNLRTRLRAAREGLTGVRLQLIAAALDLGLLDALDEGPASTEQLAGRLGAVNQDLLAAYLRVLAAAGLITGEDSWRLTRFGRAVVGDDPVRASYEGFGGYHTELYRQLPALLRGAPGRDTAEQGEVIARLSAAIYPLIRDLLVRTVTERRPRLVLDIGWVRRPASILGGPTRCPPLRSSWRCWRPSGSYGPTYWAWLSLAMDPRGQRSEGRR